MIRRQLEVADEVAGDWASMKSGNDQALRLILEEPTCERLTEPTDDRIHDERHNSLEDTRSTIRWGQAASLLMLLKPTI